MLCQKLIAMKRPCLFCGPTGTGKTAYMQAEILGADPEHFTNIVLGFSAKSRCDQVQDTIEGKLDRRRKGVYGPPSGKEMLVMVDDLNMPLKEKFGAQPPIEILRMLMDGIAYPPTGGFYDRKDVLHPFKKIMDVQMHAAMRPPGGGATFITQRLSSQFHLLAFTLLDDDNLSRIFTQILDVRLGVYEGEVRNLAKKLVGATLAVYKFACESLRPTPLKVHYTFNLR